jgi:hypothetical protein
MNRPKHSAAAFQAKQQDLEERSALRTSQCTPPSVQRAAHFRGWVEKKNRRSERELRCHCCGQWMHADVNAAWNLGHDVRAP